jgi:acetyltransferase-like isoleucine patch superfamily enzyme
MKRIIKLTLKLLSLPIKCWRRACMISTKQRFAACGQHVVFNPFDSFSYDTITIGNDVFIGKGAVFSASDSSISIGNKVMFGPNVSIMGGDHNTTTLGKYMYDVHEKLPDNDLPVIIEDDTWIGCGATILKGVTIARGSIVAAGSLVLKSCEPYSVLAGVPACVIKKRFTDKEITEHENIISGQIN